MITPSCHGWNCGAPGRSTCTSKTKPAGGAVCAHVIGYAPRLLGNWPTEIGSETVAVACVPVSTTRYVPAAGKSNPYHEPGARPVESNNPIPEPSLIRCGS